MYLSIDNGRGIAAVRNVSKTRVNKIPSNDCSFLIAFHSMQDEQPVQGMELQEKDSTNILIHTKNLFRKNLEVKGVC